MGGISLFFFSDASEDVTDEKGMDAKPASRAFGRYLVNSVNDHLMRYLKTKHEPRPGGVTDRVERERGFDCGYIFFFHSKCFAPSEA